MTEAVQNNFWTDRLVFVTGATGLVGGCLVQKLLKAQADVVCLVRDWVPNSELVRDHLMEQVRVVRGDVRDQEVLERCLAEYEVDTVFHLAAQTIVPIACRDPAYTFDVNIGGTWALLEACRRIASVKQIIFASSDKAYGASETLPYREETPLRGVQPYEVSKSCADLIAQCYSVSFGLPVVISRCGNLFGGGDLNWSRIVPGTIRSVIRGQCPVIRSDGDCVREYFYVEEAAAALILLAERLAGDSTLSGEAFNFSYERPMSVLELVDVILHLMNSHLRPEIRDQASGEIPRQHLNTAKARRVLGWKPAFGLESGLERTIRWYRDLLGAAA